MTHQKIHRARRPRLLAAACVTGLLSTLGVIGTATSAPAADANLTVVYDASGTSTIAKTRSTVSLGPTTLTTSLAPADGSFTGTLPLPNTRTSFRALGVLPTTATVGFREAAPVTGRLLTSGRTSTVTSTATYFITLRDIKVAGLPAFEGPNCQTAAPVTIPANTPPGEVFSLINGGRLTGTYTIGRFQNCGLTTGIINLLVPGGGNTVDIRVSNGRIG